MIRSSDPTLQRRLKTTIPGILNESSLHCSNMFTNVYYSGVLYHLLQWKPAYTEHKQITQYFRTLKVSLKYTPSDNKMHKKR